MPLLLHQQFDRRLVGSSTAPRGVRVISVVFAVLSIAALAIFIISIWRNIDGPPLGIKVARIGLPIIVLAGAYMVRRLWRSGFWVFSIGALLWFLLLTRSLLVADKNLSALILIGALWCFALGTLIYLAKVRRLFLRSAPLLTVSQSILPTALPIETPPTPFPTEQEIPPPPEKTQNESMPLQ